MKTSTTRISYDIGRLGDERLGSVLVDTIMVRVEKIYLSLGRASQQ